MIQDRVESKRMSSIAIAVLVALTIFASNLEAQQTATSQNQVEITYKARVINSTVGDSTCPSNDRLQMARDEVTNEVRTLLRERICGGTFGWRQIAYIDMTNSEDQCPEGLEELNITGQRLCGKSAEVAAMSQTCASTTFSTNGMQYDEVCGRVVAFQLGAPTAFGFYDALIDMFTELTIDTYYVDGTTLTHGADGNREHIWTFATGKTESLPPGDREGESPIESCPCVPGISASAMIPPFIGDDYFCESGAIDSTTNGTLYAEDPLWDGEGCFQSTNNNCCTFRNPPYFTKVLPSNTSDDIELRSCGFHSYATQVSSDTLIQLIELYVK